MSWSENTPFFSVTVGQADSGDYVCGTWSQNTPFFSVTVGQADSGDYVCGTWSQNTPFFSVTVGQADSGDYVCRTCHGARTHHSVALLTLSVSQTAAETECLAHTTDEPRHHSIPLWRLGQRLTE